MHEWDSIIFIMVLTKHLEGVTWPGVKTFLCLHEKQIKCKIFFNPCNQDSMSSLCYAQVNIAHWSIWHIVYWGRRVASCDRHLFFHYCTRMCVPRNHPPGEVEPWPGVVMGWGVARRGQVMEWHHKSSPHLPQDHPSPLPHQSAQLECLRACPLCKRILN